MANKKEKNLHKELSKRKWKKPGHLSTWFYHLVDTTKLLGGQYNPEIKIIDDVNDCKGPCFIIFNHLSRRDHAFLTLATYPRPYNMVAQYNEFFRSHLHFAFKHARILPKKVYVQDFLGVAAMHSIIKQGGVVAFSPEGTSSIDGHNQPIVPGTARFIKHYGIPVYYFHIEGSYLTNTKVNSFDRIGKVKCTMSLLFTPEKLKEMSEDEITDAINDAFTFNDYEWNKKERVEFKDPDHGVATNLHDICYKCPRCGAEAMEAEGNKIVCKQCGNGATMDDYHDLHPFDDKCVIPQDPSKWHDYERAEVAKEIRANPDFCMSFPVKLGWLPIDHWVPNKGTSEICGEGIFTIDHKGIRYEGTKLGEPFSFAMDYKECYSFPIVADLTGFGIYPNGTFYEILPTVKEHIVGKAILVCEEMSRYHYNVWKQLHNLEYIYEGMELGIDNKKETK